MKKQAERRTGNGRDCITHPEHGPSIAMPSGREWCPHQTHDGRHDVKATTPWLDRQDSDAEAPEAHSA